MATLAHDTRARRNPLDSDLYEKILAVAAIVLLLAALTAIARGYPQWGRVPAVVWAHLATILIAVALTPVMLLRRRGDRRHRALGTIWVAAMLGTAIITLFVHTSGPGRFSFIHILSVWTIIQVPIIWWSARHHNLARHRGSVRGMVTGALIIAGFFTFPFHRLLGNWLFG